HANPTKLQSSNVTALRRANQARRVVSPDGREHVRLAAERAGASKRAGASMSDGLRLNARTHLVNGFYRLRSTRTGFWPSAVNVPTSPSTAVTATAVAAALSSGAGHPTNGSV